MLMRFALARDRRSLLFESFIKGGVKSHKITVQGGEQKGELGYAYGRWEADAGGKKIGGHIRAI